MLILVESIRRIKDLRKSILIINGVELILESSVKLLGIETDNKLNFEKHISSICKQATNQLNATCRLQIFMGRKEQKNSGKHFRPFKF